MMGFFSTNWGDVASGVGFFVSLVGLVWVYLEARSARSASEKAQSASQAAETAASEARDQIARQLQAVDLVRAIEFIQRIKTLHDIERWEATTELYQPLHNMLSDIIMRCPENRAEFRGKLSTGRIMVGDMEKVVRRRTIRAISRHERSSMNENLINIQSDLEELASTTGFGDPQGETK